MNNIKTLSKSIREYRRTALMSPVLIMGEVALECVIPLLMARLIDSMMGNATGPIIRYGLILIVLALCSLFCGAYAARFAATAGCGFAKNLRHDLFYKIQTFSFADIDTFSASSLVTRMTTDVSNVQNAFQMLIRGALRAPLMIIFSVVMSLSISPRMSLIFLIMLPVLLIVMFTVMRRVFPIFRRIFKKYDAMNNLVQENVSGIRVVKSFVREEYETEKFMRASDEVRRDFTYVEKIMALLSPVMMTCIFTAITLVSIIGARMIITSAGSALTTGELSSLINYGIQILTAVMFLTMTFAMMTIASEPADRISKVLNYESTLTSPEGGLTEVPDGSISFENVSFRYNAGTGGNALSDIDLVIPAGSTLGIIGGTGSSKTTLIQLISRLYDVTEGSVKVGGHDVREYDLTVLRDAVSVVLQKNVLFSGTIRENLRWGDAAATDEEIKRACEIAQADEFISGFPDGYDTYLEQGGTNVSGGQKQRLCIARAILKKPKILIFDDSTSAVDTRTDALIRRGLSKELPGMTKIIIAQRVSSVEDADQIIVMDDGRIAEQGTHEELVAAGGIYREVYDSQVNGFGGAAADPDNAAVPETGSGNAPGDRPDGGEEVTA